MVVEQGMGKKLRNLVFHSEGGGEGIVFERMMHDKTYSDDTARLIDTEVEGLIVEAAERAELVINSNKPFLKKMADKLLETETVDEKEILEIFKGTKMPKTAALAA